MDKTAFIQFFKKVTEKKFKNQKEIDKKIKEIAELEAEFQVYFTRTAFNKKCEQCKTVCCIRSILKYLYNRPHEAYFIAKQNPDFEKILLKNTAEDDMCFLLGKKGCLLSPYGRPKACITYVCQQPYRANCIDRTNQLSEKFMELKELMEDG